MASVDLIRAILRLAIPNSKSLKNESIELAVNAEKLSKSKSEDKNRKISERIAGKKLLKIFANSGNLAAEKTLGDIEDSEASFREIRTKGTETLKLKSGERKEAIISIHKNLMLEDSNYSKQKLEKKAEIVRDESIRRNVFLENDKPYSERTIKNLITGIK